ncbi:uncharacterized protein [Lepeophtheirus salmonis]|nr:uncharacterized protein LOC121118891 isoform X1 [Lepeophtheirus salmonis]
MREGESPNLNSRVGFHVLNPHSLSISEIEEDLRRIPSEKDIFLKVPNIKELEGIGRVSEGSSTSFGQQKTTESRHAPTWHTSPTRLIRDHSNPRVKRGLMDTRNDNGGDLMDPRLQQQYRRSRRRVIDEREEREDNEDPEYCRHPQSRICDNLKYNLQQLKLRSQKDTYLAVVDAAIIGPEPVRSYEVESILGISNDTFLKTRLRRKEALEYEDFEFNRDRVEEMRELQTRRRSSYKSLNSNNSNKNGHKTVIPRPALKEQFELFARYGDPQSIGELITLSQTDKWLRQAGIIDNWNITTTDTAIYYRKISRGSKYLDYDSWRAFLDELAWRKRISVEYLIDKLEICGKPSYSNTTTASLSDPFLQRGLRVHDC